MATAQENWGAFDGVIADGLDQLGAEAALPGGVLVPVRANAEEMRARLARAGIDPGDVQSAVAWARRRRR